MKKVELLAPAGSFEALAAALQAGADAVYFGIEQLNMRARASNNFVVEDLEEIVSRCHAEEAKAYLTVNTVLYNHDLTLMRRIVQAAKVAKVDAIIASDPAVMAYAKEVGVPIHISTQANVSNIDALSFYAHFGDLMVLARELSLKQVKEMAREIERRQIKGPSGNLVKLEIFAHGALCMAVSGKCYLSLHSHNASANRGACIQNCRRTYEVTDREDGTTYEIDNEYIMSAKDLCTIDFLDKIVDSGVSVIKIEGRARAADYVYTVTKCYREALDAIAAGTYTSEKIEVWKSELDKVYNRGFWDGYYLGRKMGEWSDSYGSVATTKKIFLGKMTHFFNKISVGEFQMETQQLKLGDEIMFIGPVTGVHQQIVSELRVNDQQVISVEKGQVFSMPLERPIKNGDRLYKIVDA
ncbi:peptidase U32 family protein [Fontibacter flavus]|uniref:Peptidase U32 family protein n=1 Tax=Fontibacter flavus TaxID=654838 RepID=A0ABV6FTG6_9BACT